MTIAVNTLVSTVGDIVADSTYIAADIIAFLNEGHKRVAGRVLLPDLETIASLVTDTDNNVALPADFHRNLTPWVYSVTSDRRLKLYNSVADLFMAVGTVDAEGALIGVARNKSLLYYQPIPASAETFQIVYHAYPTDMVAGGNVPAGIPEHLVEPVLAHYAAWRIFEQIEDGVEGEKVNSVYHKSFHEEAVKQLEAFIGGGGE